ncbi:DNA-3-methyladenine glycosylase [Rickettsia tamurae]|uniref:Putative 3-methyladenine DNA glycosylase n=1 Tax=Rickettsia tamurae subsp. buchneri TaxID=1462938 RepID=A0A8E0WNC0_9RICK|nr:DNA-3-methyladenine glycosylase [Rickettsia tamurae]KDO03644.1 3-methyladenine DNA glycosylase [Rickettsia tamurae subsp. buchneri]
MNLNPLPREFFARDTNLVSTELIGKALYFQGKTAIITETESYIGQDDPACHAAKGWTKRTDIMFGPAGFSYVYLIYGMYYCLNFVTEAEGFPAATLIRGVHVISPENLYLNGPGKLCKYLGINISHNKCNLINNNEFFVSDIGLKLPYSTTTRIGITKGTDKLWRYVVTDITNLISQYNVQP